MNRLGSLCRVLLPALLLLTPAWGHAEGYLTTEQSVRRVGMRTVLAHPDDLTALTHNPAGLLLSPGTSLYVGYTGALGDLGLRVYDESGALAPEQEITPELYFSHLPYVALASDFGISWLRVGTTVNLARGRWLEFDSQQPTRTSLTKDTSLTLRWSTAAAFRISPKFDVGLAVDVLHSYRNWALAANEANLAALPESAGGLLERTGQGTAVRYNLGFHFQPIRPLELGVVFATGTLMELEGEVRKTTLRHTTSFAIPFQVAGGVQWRINRHFDAALDARMWHYQVNQEERSVYSDGHGEHGSPKLYEQSYAWSLGLTYRPLPQLELLVGYEQDFSAASERTYQLDVPVHDGQTIGLGIRYEVVPGLRLGLAAARTWYALLDIQNSALEPAFNAKVHGSMMEGTGDVQWTF